MSETKFSNLRLSIILSLSAIAIAGGIITLLRYEPGEEILIRLVEESSFNGSVFIDGEVNLPGFYPYSEEESIQSLINAAGGLTENSDVSKITLIAENNESDELPQKIDINRAETWLLQALPGIGETLAKRIFEFREETGPFNNTLEIMEVEGIGPGVYEKIKQYITVSE